MDKELRDLINQYQIDKVLPKDILTKVQLYTFQKDDIVVFAENDPGDLSIIVSGRCLVKPLGNEGQETILTYLYPGDLIGDIELFTKRSYLHFVYAQTKVQLIKIPARYVTAELSDYVPFLHFVIDRTFDKLLNHSVYFSDTRLYGIKARVIKYILDVSERLQTYEIPFKYSSVVQFIGVSERQLRRIIKSLEKEQLIEKTYMKLRILNNQKLTNYIEKSDN